MINGTQDRVPERKFREIYDLYYSFVFHLLYLKIGSPEDVEELCHEIFISLYKNYYSIDDMKKWLRGAIKNSIAGFYRKREKTVPNVQLELIDESDHPAQKGSDSEIKIILIDAIENNSNYDSEKDRIIFDLIAIQKYSYGGVSKHLNISKRQVEYSYKKSASRIVEYLRQKGIKGMADVV